MTTGQLTKLIDSAITLPEHELRDYLGASIIGSSCMRQIWYIFNNYPRESFTPKQQRTFDIGHALEDLVLDWLENAGFKLARVWYDLQSDNAPYLKGHLDAVLLNDNDEAEAIIEIKTAKNASYNIFVKKGLKVWNAQYYAQVQAYMGMSNIPNAYILVLNKDNSDISDELITFDADFYNQLELKAISIFTAKSMPPRINNSPLWYQCKLCPYNKICHTKE